jgi:hypothetical protein
MLNVGSKCFPLIENASLKIPFRNISNFTLFAAALINCPSERCATAAYLIRNGKDVFRKQVRTLKHIFTLVAFYVSYVSIVYLTCDYI